MPAGDLLGVDDRPAAARVLATDDRAAMVEAMEGYLLALDPVLDPVAEQVRGWVSHAEQDRTLTRAEQLAEHAGVGLRTLQRLFTDYVGIGPKWVVQRYRVLDAAAVAHAGHPVDWAALAARARLQRPGPPDQDLHPGGRHPAGHLLPQHALTGRSWLSGERR